MNTSHVIKTVETETKTTIDTDKIVDGMDAIYVPTSLTIQDVTRREKIAELVKRYNFTTFDKNVVIVIPKVKRFSFLFIALMLMLLFIILVTFKQKIIVYLLTIDVGERLSSVFDRSGLDGVFV